MPLNIGALKVSPGLPGAGDSDYPPTIALCAKAWADAVEAWAAGILPASSTVTVAATALEGALATAFAQPAAAPAMETAFASFAVAVGLGMAGHAPVPPPDPVGFATAFAMPAPAARQGGVDRIADLLDAWLRTGSATLIAPPGTLLIWS